MGDTGKIEARNVAYRYGGTSPLSVLSGVNFTIAPGEFVCIVGPSGCGKSTLLHLLCGFLKATAGEITIDGLASEGPNAQRGIVFQDNALFPWKTVRQNVEFGPRVRGLGREQCRAIAEGFIERVGLTGFEDNYAVTLSGGMRQKVGIARALANGPAVLMMDEPFGSLDALTKIAMQGMLLRIWEESRRTVVFVTHDIDEAVLLADRILICTPRPGRIQECIPVELPRPRNIEAVTSTQFVDVKRRIMEALRVSLSGGWNGAGGM